MAILIRDNYLERRVESERTRRGDKSLAKTARELVNERLTQLEERGDGPTTGTPTPAEAGPASGGGGSG